MYDIGWEDYISQNAVVIIEWSVNISDILDMEHITVTISKDLSVSEQYREIVVEGAVI